MAKAMKWQYLQRNGIERKSSTGMARRHYGGIQASMKAAAKTLNKLALAARLNNIIMRASAGARASTQHKLSPGAQRASCRSRINESTAP
jgi:hypothetical protein